MKSSHTQGDNVGDPRVRGDGGRSIVIMGPAGCGKTTIGTLLAQSLGGRFVDADDHHSTEARAKMGRGMALSDEDRAPWLGRLAKLLERDETTVLACSALKTSYRRALASGSRRVIFVHLNVPSEELNRRLERRMNHFAGPALLQSQLSAWEAIDESSKVVQLSVDGVGTPEEVLSRVLSAL